LDFSFLLILFGGFAAGYQAALFGIGGGVLTTPLLLGMGLSLAESIGTSILFICCNALVITYRNYRAKLIDVQKALITAACMIPAFELCAFANKYINHLQLSVLEQLQALFFILFIIVSTIAYLGIKESSGQKKPSYFTLITSASTAGAISGFLGLGGGRVLVPVFGRLFHLGTKTAIATSSAVIFFSSLYGSTSYSIKGLIQYPQAAILIAAGIPGAFLGGNTLRRCSPRVVKYCYVLLSAGSALAIGFGTAGLQEVGLSCLLGASIIVLGVSSLQRKRTNG